MIHEFALDPGLLDDWERFRYLTEKFSVCQGRLISRYPKRWKAMVYEAASEASDIERKRIEVRLQGIDDKMLPRTHQWDGNQGWLVNAECEHGRQPFHAIIAHTNPQDHDWILACDDLDEVTPRWAIERERIVSRDAAALAAAVSPIVRAAKSVIFIDPHFDPYKARVRNTLKAFLEACFPRRVGLAMERVEFHTAFKPEVIDFVKECQRQLPQRIPTGVSLRIVRWRERVGGEGLHNRYILTERGGVRLAWGLDEGGHAQTDDLSLLEPTLYGARWGQYCSEQPAFDFVDDLVVVGTRVLP
ncbi:hypothetical protein [Accumulibacter sp.]|uniref:hypothetical protein n=1 Tax=Accumulibacter sp. TaxID=2053492 RepID=UPI00263A2FD7|nr:hypothetical protein [Accumulibacter sp.]